MKIIGLTGGIASGKSTVSQMLMDEGLTVLDADILAREVVKPGSFGLRALYQVFGPDVLDGENLNRTFLGEKIFSDEGARAVVERITHPLIQWRAAQEFRWLETRGAKAVIYDAALIFEKNLMGQFDQIYVVHVPVEVQIQRLMARDKISSEIAHQRLKSQLPIEKKMSQANALIDNSGSRDETKKQVGILARQLLR